MVLSGVGESVGAVVIARDAGAKQSKTNEERGVRNDVD
jgi:hypothetical protein